VSSAYLFANRSFQITITIMILFARLVVINQSKQQQASQQQAAKLGGEPGQQQSSHVLHIIEEKSVAQLLSP
jgi:hypothetical protein